MGPSSGGPENVDLVVSMVRFWPRLCENSSLKRTIADRNSGEADEPIHRG